jgi:hypothetical protein
MKRQGVRCKFQGRSDAARGHSLLSGPDKQAVHIQAIFLRKRGQSRDSIGVFHISIIVEIFSSVKNYFDDN